MKILIDAMVVILVYMVGYKMGVNDTDKLWCSTLHKIIQEELERRENADNTREDKTEA